MTEDKKPDVFDGIVTATEPLIVDDGTTARKIDDVNQPNPIKIGDAVRVKPDGIRFLDENPMSEKTDEKDT